MCLLCRTLMVINIISFLSINGQIENPTSPVKFIFLNHVMLVSLIHLVIPFLLNCFEWIVIVVWNICLHGFFLICMQISLTSPGYLKWRIFLKLPWILLKTWAIMMTVYCYKVSKAVYTHFKMQTLGWIFLCIMNIMAVLIRESGIRIILKAVFHPRTQLVCQVYLFSLSKYENL